MPVRNTARWAIRGSRLVSVVLPLLLAPRAPVIAQDWAADLVGTWSVSSQPVMSDGTLIGCTLVYDVFYQDWTYRGGGFVRVSGHVGFLHGQNAIGAALKVAVNEIDPYAAQLEMVPSAPFRAYIVADDFSTNLPSLVTSGPSDTPGALYSVFQLSPTFEMVMAALESQHLTIAFGEEDSALDIQIPIELDVLRVDDSGQPVRSTQTRAAFLNCLTALTEAGAGDVNGN